MRASRVLPVVLVACLSGCSTLRQPEELTWQALRVVDVLQTMEFRVDPCVEEAHSITRRIIGKEPTKEAVIMNGIGGAAIHLGVSHFLRERYPRSYALWQTVSIFDTGSAVYGNHAIGIRIGGPNRTRCGNRLDSHP